MLGAVLEEVKLIEQSTSVRPVGGRQWAYAGKCVFICCKTGRFQGEI